MRGKVNDYCMYSRSLWQEEHDFSKVIAIRYHIAIHSNSQIKIVGCQGFENNIFESYKGVHNCTLSSNE